MRRIALLAAVAAGMLWPAVPQAQETDLGKRLDAVMAADCSGKVWSVISCENRKAMALNAYGQRLLLKSQCPPTSDLPVMSPCRKYDMAIEKAIFGK